MKSFLRLTDLNKEEILEIFKIAEDIQRGKYTDFLHGKSVIMFFPETSIRTRASFEKGVYLLGGQTILFPPETLDKKEDIRDVVGYLNQWADAIIVRHKDMTLLEKMSEHAKVPVINAMTDVNHPCEMLSDLYALSKTRKNFFQDAYLFCGEKGNIGMAWKEAAEVMGLSFSQCCPAGYEMEGIPHFTDIHTAVIGKDIICTDSIPKQDLEAFKNYQVTKELMEKANPGAILNPCPPFYRGEEVSEDVIDSAYFVGYEFKKYLLEMQQAILIFTMLG